jgi:hypothetical protein
MRSRLMLLTGDLCALGGKRVALAEGSGVFAEFGEGIEGASPEDSALLERGKHGAYEGEGEDQGAQSGQE